MIIAEGLARTFGRDLAVEDASFIVEPRRISGFLGPNGAGKSTTLRMLATTLAPTAGSAKVAGYDIVSNAAEVRARIGYLPERPPLYPELTVEEYLKYMAGLRGVAARDLKKSVDKALSVCALQEVRLQLCRYLSKGFAQRVGLAQAIIHKPEVIILDEPVSGMDPQQVVQVRNLITWLSERSTILLSTHLLSEVSALCDDVVIIHNGKVVLQSELDLLTGDSSLEEVYLNIVSSVGDSTKGELKVVGL